MYRIVKGYICNVTTKEGIKTLYEGDIITDGMLDENRINNYIVNGLLVKDSGKIAADKKGGK
jgi:hypothetical protein